MIGDSRQKNLLPFIYAVSSGAIAANSQTVTNLTLNQDSVFELHHFLGRTSADLANDPHPNNFSVLIKDSGTGRELMNRAIGQNLVCGPQNESIREYRPVQFSPGTILEFTFINLTGVQITVEFAMKGYKLFGL